MDLAFLTQQESQAELNQADHSVDEVNDSIGVDGTEMFLVP